SPVIGVRVSRSADVPAGTRRSTVASDSIAESTSALVTTPPAPLPGRCLALIPWSFASLRTSGDDTGEACRPEVGAGTVAVDAGSSAAEAGAPAVLFAGSPTAAAAVY